jgi:hypothetical protein
MDITPHTRVGALLEAHPELEDVLIAAAPAFQKLKNPVLRATVAQVATLEHAAKVAGLPVFELVGRLRAALSLDPVTRMRVPGGQEGPAVEAGAESLALADWPDWVQAERVAATLDAAGIVAAGGHPLDVVRQTLATGAPGTIVVVHTDFEPAPLLALAPKEGLRAACVRDGSGYRTALAKA